MWAVGDSACDTLDWHGYLLGARVVPVAPFNARNADDPKAYPNTTRFRFSKYSVGVRRRLPSTAAASSAAASS